MRQVGGNQALEGRHQLVHALGRQVQLEELDGNEALALRVVKRAKHRPQRPRTNLMKNTKPTECVRRDIDGSVRVQ